ncbi:hypothetical protein EJ07DRAFT_154677 [Lizonia empirigonia]|nr:hypothetical protein EJ07DRAFT_154677 [Lizonia empirigonia]
MPNPTAWGRGTASQQQSSVPCSSQALRDVKVTTSHQLTAYASAEAFHTAEPPPCSSNPLPSTARISSAPNAAVPPPIYPPLQQPARGEPAAAYSSIHQPYASSHRPSARNPYNTRNPARPAPPPTTAANPIPALAPAASTGASGIAEALGYANPRIPLDLALSSTSLLANQTQNHPGAPPHSTTPPPVLSVYQYPSHSAQTPIPSSPHASPDRRAARNPHRRAETKRRIESACSGAAACVARG